MVAPYSKWKTHATAISLVGLVGMIAFAVLLSMSKQEPGMRGVGLGIVAIIVAIGALFDALVTTALVILVRTKTQVILVHVVVAVASFAVVFGMR